MIRLLQRCTSVRLSVRLSICQLYSGIVSKRGNVEGCGLHRRVAAVSSFSRQEWFMGDDHVLVKFECKEVEPTVKTAELYTLYTNLITPERNR